MSLYLFGYEIPVNACCHCVSWTLDGYGKTYWHRTTAVYDCSYHQGFWWIIDDVDYYLGRDPYERDR